MIEFRHPLKHRNFTFMASSPQAGIDGVSSSHPAAYQTHTPIARFLLQSTLAFVPLLRVTHANRLSNWGSEWWQNVVIFAIESDFYVSSSFTFSPLCWLLKWCCG